MHVRTHSLLLAAALLALAACLPRPATAAAAEGTPPSPAALVKERSSAILETLVAERATFAAEPARLHAFIRDQLDALFDHEYSARLVLAQHGRGAAKEEVDAFARALLDNLLRRYGNALLEVDPGLEVTVKGETPLRGGAIVRVATEIAREGGAPVPVDYLFRDTPNGWKVFDVIVEGVSYVQTYRTQFAEQLRNKSLAQVTAELEQGRIDVAAE